MYDSHIHSNNSHDGRDSVELICETALARGVKAVAVTDHIDLQSYVRRNALETVQQSIRDAKAAKERYKGRLEVLCGVELGGYALDREVAERVMAFTDYDVIVGSLHYVNGGLFDKAFAGGKFDESVSDDQIIRFLGQYFDELLVTAREAGVHVLAHLTCPMRYIKYRYKRNVDVMIHQDKIIEILKTIIRRGIALEVNTSGYTERYDYSFDAGETILRLYRELGGELITLGSDAHVVKNIAHGFPEAMEMLKGLGFDGYYYFRQGKPVKVPFVSGKESSHV